MNRFRLRAFLFLVLSPSVARAEKPVIILIKPDFLTVQPRPLPRLIAAIANYPHQNHFVLRFWTASVMSLHYTKVNYNKKTQTLFLASGATRSGKSLIRYLKVTPAILKKCYGLSKQESESSDGDFGLVGVYNCPEKIISSMTWYVSP